MLVLRCWHACRGCLQLLYVRDGNQQGGEGMLMTMACLPWVTGGVCRQQQATARREAAERRRQQEDEEEDMRAAAIREAALAAEAAERAEQERRQVGAVVPRRDGLLAAHFLLARGYNEASTAQTEVCKTTCLVQQGWHQPSCCWCMATG